MQTLSVDLNHLGYSTYEPGLGACAPMREMGLAISRRLEHLTLRNDGITLEKGCRVFPTSVAPPFIAPLFCPRTASNIKRPRFRCTGP